MFYGVIVMYISVSIINTCMFYGVIVMYISVSIINTCKRRDVLWSNSYVYLCIYNKYM